MKGSLILVIAIVVGVLAAVLVRQQINSERDQIVNQWEPVGICVAADRLAQSTSIDIDTDLEEKLLPKSFAKLNDYVLWTDRQTLQGAFINTVIEKNKIIDRRYLGQRATGSKEVIKPATASTRLLAIKVNEVTGTAGHLRPGDYVDVLHTSGELVTQLILENVRIKHTGRPERGRGSSGRNSNYTTVTLEIPVRQAMILTNAGSTGTLTLIKRNGVGQKVGAAEAKPIKPGDYRSQLN